METDTLREMIKKSAVEVVLNNSQTYTLQSPETTIVSDFEVSTLVPSKRGGLRAAYIAIDAISTASPVGESV